MSLARFIVNVEVAIYRKGLWFVIQRPDTESHAAGMLAFVGGKVEASDSSIDTLESAALREVFEEVGAEVAKLRYVESKMFTSAKGNTVINIVFMTTAGDDFCPRCSDEVAEIFWLTKDEILGHPKSPLWLKASLEQCSGVL